MGKIGQYEYPDLSLEDCIETARQIMDNFGTDEFDRETFGDLVGVKGGALGRRITSLKRYGMIEGRDKLKLTEIADVLVNPSSDEEEVEVKGRAIEEVPLFQELNRKIGDKVPKDKFWVILRNITGCTGSEAKSKAGEIAKVYIEGAAYLSSEKEGQEKGGQPKRGDTVSRPATVKALIELGRIEEGKESLDELLRLSEEAELRGLNTLVNFFKENPQAFARNESLVKAALKDLNITDEEEQKIAE